MICTKFCNRNLPFKRNVTVVSEPQDWTRPSFRSGIVPFRPVANLTTFFPKVHLNVINVIYLYVPFHCRSQWTSHECQSKGFPLFSKVWISEHFSFLNERRDWRNSACAMLYTHLNPIARASFWICGDGLELLKAYFVTARRDGSVCLATGFWVERSRGPQFDFSIRPDRFLGPRSVLRNWNRLLFPWL
jgi:hypothetical protein